MSSYFIEICSEEMPADFVNVGVDYLLTAFEKLFNDNRISYTHITADGTPRRLFAFVEGLADRQSDQEEEIVGPPASVAFDRDGKLTPVGINFANAKGLAQDTLRKISTPKGEYLAGVKFTKGKPTKEIILEHIVRIIQSIPFKKTMKWGDKSFRYARPVKSFISLFDGEVLPFDIEDIVVSNKTVGHRFHGNECFEVKDYNDYVTGLQNRLVAPHRKLRTDMIKEAITKVASENNVKVDIDEELLATVTNLVEYPFAVLGSFSKEFLALPEEVLITSMKNHQKYFHTIDDNGKITNFFIGISNTRPVNDNIRKGYERVLRARLKDAMFFFENDKEILLSERVEQLKKVVYQEKLGTSYEKVERFTKLTKYILDCLSITGKEREDVLRTAYLCKADLMTEMVYEFPELQGVMGREYARLQGENEQVALGIYEHYLPKFAGDGLPSTLGGSIVSIADKIDTICGCFAIGLIPSGNNDPYALRRNAIGVLQIIRSREFRIDLDNLIGEALDNLLVKVRFSKDEVKRQVVEFIKLRFKQLLINEGISFDAIDAVIDMYGDILKIERSARVLSSAKPSASFNSITQSYKRINNILKKAGHTSIAFSCELFESEYEKKLYERINSMHKDFLLYLEKEEYEKALDILLTLEEPINSFFDNVMVMVDNDAIRVNRLSFLASLKEVFDRVGNLSLIS